MINVQNSFFAKFRLFVTLKVVLEEVSTQFYMTASYFLIGKRE